MQKEPNNTLQEPAGSTVFRSSVLPANVSGKSNLSAVNPAGSAQLVRSAVKIPRIFQQTLINKY
jgi:hypothetical protein